MSTQQTNPTEQAIEKHGDQRPLALQKSDPQNIEALITRMAPAMAAALPKHLTPDRMCRIALTALRTNKDLAQCSPASFLASVMQAAQLGLEVNTPIGEAYLVPFKRQVQLIIGYQGYMTLARRSGQVGPIYAYPVYEGDTFEYELGLNPTVKHVPKGKYTAKDKAKLTHVYGISKLKTGEPIVTVLTRSQVDYYRDRSRAKNSGPWVTDYEAMAIKTAIRRLYRWLPKSAEMSVAAGIEESQESHGVLPVDPEVLAMLQDAGADVESLEAEGEEVADREDSPEPVPPGTDGRRIKLGQTKAAADTAAREPGQEG